MLATVTADTAFEPGVTTLITEYAMFEDSHSFAEALLTSRISGAPGMPSVK